MDSKGQGAFEYLLLIGGAILFVILVIAIVQGSLNAQSSGTANQSSKISEVNNNTYSSIVASR